MRVRSFVRSGSDLVPIEVELVLAQGLPQIQFLGLPDAGVKESALRIRTALREQGFQLPQAQQILVHLRPSQLRKSSQGLDLAVAAALLWETGQLPAPESATVPTLYGELTLQGRVVRPEDAVDLDVTEDVAVYTGSSDEALPFASFQLRELKDLARPVEVSPASLTLSWRRPTPRASGFPAAFAEVAKVVAAGEHSALLAGAPGSGKTTLAECIASWIDDPEPRTQKIAMRIARRVGRELDWRPVVRPHHSITPLAMVGGGQTLWPGEITRAHGGVLIMDELLEFHADIQEALREPMETGSISLVRGGAAKTLPARFILLATSNLCRCGRYFPSRESLGCRCPRSVRRRSLARLAGPFADRFPIMTLIREPSTDDSGAVSCEAIAVAVERAVAFRKGRGQERPNSEVSIERIERGLSESWRLELARGAAGKSRRRWEALLRVSRTYADLEGCEDISQAHVERAFDLTIAPHQLLQEWQE